MPPAGVTLRRKTDADREALCALYASTRTEELAQVPWPEAAKDVFLRSQFDAQWAHYETHYADADLDVLERDGELIGRLYVYRKHPTDIRIVDIALVAAARGSGLGTHLIGEVLDEANRAGKSVSIHVEQFNPALRLYERLGFQRVHENGAYFLMRWSGSAGVREL
jgi:ribosomal protein S18 acetylase RimI-like enzyme